MSAAAPDTWMPLWIGPYLANTLHLNRAQHGSYCLLIMACWKAGGRLPANDETLTTIARCTPREWRAERAIFSAFFEVDTEWWVHPRVMAELEKARGFKDKQTRNGGKGGRPPKPKKTQTQTQTVTQEKPKPEPNANPNGTTLPLPNDVTATESVASSQRENPNGRQTEPTDDAGWEPEAPGSAPEPQASQPKTYAAGRQQPIPADWMPSDQARRDLARSRPDITPELFDRRMVEFHAWCKAENKHTHNPDATWLGFMVKTHAQRPSHSTPSLSSESAVSAGISAAVARRSFPNGG